jgi:three-Cys-motif partner protein
VPDDFLASDGLAARPSQPYAMEKLHYAGHYQQIFATGMKNLWEHRVYLDLLAGPGICKIRETGEEFPGSPLRSLDAPFTRRIFVEADPVLHDALAKRVPDHCDVLLADCNDRSTLDSMRDACGARGTLGLAFIDNLGLDVPFESIRYLTQGRRIDLMIVVQLHDLTRNLPETLSGAHDRGRLDAFFGGPEWLALARDAASVNTAPADIASALVTFYGEQLKRIGYTAVAESRMVMKNSRNVSIYRIVLAGKHDRAVDFFQKIEKIDPHGQRHLF